MPTSDSRAASASVPVAESRAARRALAAGLGALVMVAAARAALPIPGSPVPVTGLDLRLLGCVFEVDGRLAATAAGAAVLDHPAAAVAWFVRSLAARGRRLEAGTTVLSGALTAAVPVQPGSVVRVTVDQLGSVEMRCGQ